jgi:hypothetical protein
MIKNINAKVQRGNDSFDVYVGEGLLNKTVIKIGSAK